MYYEKFIKQEHQRKKMLQPRFNIEHPDPAGMANILSPWFDRLVGDIRVY
jgi:hypothetical protein